MRRLDGRRLRLLLLGRLGASTTWNWLLVLRRVRLGSLQYSDGLALTRLRAWRRMPMLIGMVCVILRLMLLMLLMKRNLLTVILGLVLVLGEAFWRRGLARMLGLFTHSCFNFFQAHHLAARRRTCRRLRLSRVIIGSGLLSRHTPE